MTLIQRFLGVWDIGHDVAKSPVQPGTFIVCHLPSLPLHSLHVNCLFSNKAALCKRSESSPHHWWDGMGRGSAFGGVGREVKGQASSVLGINTVVTSGKCSICLMCRFRSGTLVIVQTWQPHCVYHPSGIWSELKLFTNVWSLTFIESGL